MKKTFLVLILLFLQITSAFGDEVVGKIKVIKVFDGDTVQAQLPQGKVSIRLIGIDCYETSKIHRAYTQAYQDNLSIDEVISKGKEAKKILQRIVRKNKNEISLDFQGIDRYGRALGIIYAKEENINEKMKKTGYCPAFYSKK